MSSLVYGALTRTREDAPPPQPAERGKSAIDGVKGYVDAVAALIPAEVLAFHALALQLTTETVEAKTESTVPAAEGKELETKASEAVTAITDPALLKLVFYALLVAAPLLYALAHRGAWEKLDWIRMLIPAGAFLAWTMLQKSTAFDAIAPGFGDDPRFLLGAGIAIVLGLAARELAFKADQQT